MASPTRGLEAVEKGAQWAPSKAADQSAASSKAVFAVFSRSFAERKAFETAEDKAAWRREPCRRYSSNYRMCTKRPAAEEVEGDSKRAALSHELAPAEGEGVFGVTYDAPQKTIRIPSSQFSKSRELLETVAEQKSVPFRIYMMVDPFVSGKTLFVYKDETGWVDSLVYDKDASDDEEEMENSHIVSEVRSNRSYSRIRIQFEQKNAKID